MADLTPDKHLVLDDTNARDNLAVHDRNARNGVRAVGEAVNDINI